MKRTGRFTKKPIHRKLGTKRYVIPKNAIILNDVPASTYPVLSGDINLRHLPREI